MSQARIDLGGITMDIRKVVRQLKCDLKDDWYPDILEYGETLEPEAISSAFAKSIETNDGLFLPGCRAELNIPKKGFVLRYSLETNIIDRAYYHGLVADLAPFYDELLQPFVLSHRYASAGNRAGRYLFLHPIDQWKLFLGYFAQEAETKPALVITDVQNYFENIKVDRLIELLREGVPKINASGADKARVRIIIDHLQRCLRKWSFSDTHGLPQNRDASSFLGNIFMLPVDEEMLRRGHSYFRYMDDIRIATKSRYSARAALQDLIVELRKIGLNVNGAKTCIVEPGDPNYNDFLTVSDPELGKIDNMWRSRSLHVIRRSFEPLSRLALKLIRERRTQDRAFRFCVKRFESLALCSEINMPDAYFEAMIDTSIEELDNQPYSTDQLVRFLKAAPTSDNHMKRVTDFLLDHDRAIYDWQNYLLWQLLVYKGYHDPKLISVARQRIGASSLQADRAGAMLFLGAAGDKDDRKAVAKHFDCCEHHLLQRNALIAVHELEFNDGIKQHVAPHVLPCLNGTYKKIRDRFLGRYYLPLPPVSFVDMYDEVSSYE